MQQVMDHPQAPAGGTVPPGKQPERANGKNRVRFVRVHQIDVAKRAQQQRARPQRRVQAAVLSRVGHAFQNASSCGAAAIVGATWK